MKRIKEAIICSWVMVVILILIPTHSFSAKAFSNESLKTWLISHGFFQVPIIEKDHLLYVQGDIKQHQELFMLDTGSSSASILSDSVEKLHLNPRQTNHKTTNMTGVETVNKQVNLSDVTIGQAHLKSISASVMTGPFKNQLPTIVIGADFFNRYNAIIDISNRKLYLSTTPPSKQLKTVLRNFFNQHYQEIPLTQLPSGHFILPIQINDKIPVYFLFDTGTGQTTLADNYVGQLKLPTPRHYETQAATNGTIDLAKVEINELTFNPLQLSWQSPISINKVQIYGANISSMQTILGVSGVLGLAEMQKINIIVDYPDRMLHILL